METTQEVDVDNPKLWVAAFFACALFAHPLMAQTEGGGAEGGGLAPTPAPAEEPSEPLDPVDAVDPGEAGKAVEADKATEPAAAAPIEANAEKTEPTTTPKSPAKKKAPLHSGFGLGFAGGATSGLGFAYRHHFKNGWGFHTAGIGFGQRDFVFLNLGANGMVTFARAWLVRFYGVFGAMGVYSLDRQYDWSDCERAVAVPENGEPVDCQEKDLGLKSEFLFIPGAGVGMEFHFTDHIGFSLELPVSIWLPFDENGLVGEGFQILPVPNASLIYYF
jgi:hypothetical protein